MDENNCDLLAGIFAAEKELKQKQFDKILNILTPHNAKEVSVQVKEVEFYDAATFDGLVSQIFEKALMEPISIEMYANLCVHLSARLPVLIQNKKEISFKKVLLHKLLNELEKQPNARSRRLGNIRFIGELYKKKILTDKLMHQCIIFKLLYKDFADAEFEALCELMTIIGEMIDHPRNKEKMDMYFQRMLFLSNNTELSSRIRFMLKGVIDLRNNKWQNIQLDTIASAVSVKMYLRDFLLKLAKQCTDLPESADIAEGLMSVNIGFGSHHVPEADQMVDLQRYVRKRFDHIDTGIASFDYRMRRLENFHHDASKSRIILIMLFVLNMLVMLYFCLRLRN